MYREIHDRAARHHNCIHGHESNYDVTVEVSETHKQVEQTLTIKGQSRMWRKVHVHTEPGGVGQAPSARDKINIP